MRWNYTPLLLVRGGTGKVEQIFLAMKMGSYILTRREIPITQSCRGPYQGVGWPLPCSQLADKHWLINSTPTPTWVRTDIHWSTSVICYHLNYPDSYRNYVMSYSELYIYFNASIILERITACCTAVPLCQT